MKSINTEIREKYKKHLIEINLNKLNIKLILGLLILLYFVFSDLYLRHNILAFYTRILPASLCVLLLVINLTTKKYKFYKAKLYNIFLISLPLMMFGKCILHLNENSLASSVAGTILIIFIISLEIKTNLRNTIIIYTVPVIIFVSVLFLFFKLNSEQFLTLSNIYPIIILGFTFNRIQDNLRNKSFTANYLLDIEKNRVTQLYEKTLTQNEKIQKYANKLKKTNDTKNQFFSIISHDLKNAFNGILGYSRLLKLGLNKFSSEQIEQHINRINESSEQTYNLLINLLDWSRVQSDKIEYKPEKLLLNQVITDNIKLFKLQCEEKAISLIFNHETDIFIFADLYMLSTILRNLISNAIKFTKSGKIILNIKKETDYCKVSVQDEGIGISQENLNNLFKIDKKKYTTGTNGETGTGIGLSLCKEFVEKNKGKIFVESVINKGSIFTFTVPY